MPAGKSTKAKSRKYGRRKARVSRMPKGQMATVTQVLEISTLTTNSISNFENLSLKAFDRAAGVGRYYQYYRIKSVKVTFKPLYDTWGTQFATGSVPYLYYIIDNGYSFSPAFCATFNSMRDAGAKAIRLDDKSINVYFKPAVAVSVGDVQGATTTPFSMVKKSPWLNTNANSAGQNPLLGWAANGTDHRGIWFGVEQTVLQAGNTQVPYRVSLEAVFEFKKPLSFSNGPIPVLQVNTIDLEVPQSIAD